MDAHENAPRFSEFELKHTNIDHCHRKASFMEYRVSSGRTSSGVTLGAAIFQGRAKIGGAILFCVVSYLVWSVIKTSIEAIPTAILVANGAEEVLLNSTVLLIFLIGETLLYAGFSVGLFFLNARLIDRKLNLA